jgi:DnaK suppressor protein
MTGAEREAIKAKIAADIAALETEIGQLRAKCEPIAPDCSLGRLTRLEAMQEKEVSAHLLQEATIRLNKLEYARRKVDEPAYGLCVACEEPIAVGRLMLMPEASRCVECAG